MKSYLCSASSALLVSLSLSGTAIAQQPAGATTAQTTAAPSAATPQTAPHPPMGTSAAVPGAAPHPPMGGAGHAGAGHSMNMAGPPQDISMPDPSQPPGSVLVQVVGPAGTNIQGAKVQLKTLFQSIAQGNSEKLQEGALDALGQTHFSGLDTALRFNYAVEVTFEGGSYEIAPFRLGKTGHRVVVHVYPSTHNINDAFVGMRGFSYVQLREGFFQFDVMYRVMNLSERTWLAKGVTLNLPKGASAIDVQGRVGDAGFVEKDGKVSLVGTFPPGQKDVQFSFHVESSNRASESFVMGVPPHVAELRILAEETPNMSLDVPGFEEPQSTEGPDGKRVLITRRLMQPGQSELKSVSIDLAGLPTIGPGRWYAVILALGFVVGGAGLLVSRRGKQKPDLAQERQKAQQLLLDELVLLEQAREKDVIGPRTYEQTKREILLALARLEEPKKASSGATSSEAPSGSAQPA